MSTLRRGRKSLGDTPATRVLQIRVTAQAAKQLQRIAALNGTTRSAFIREAVDEAVSDCSDERVFRRS